MALEKSIKMSKFFCSNLHRFSSRPYVNQPEIGKTFHGFTVTECSPIRNFTLIKLVHETGALYYHVNTDDSNNVFGIGFKTLPENDRGVPHVLEHLVLCGSKKYPVNDPFMQMQRKSLNSFMNAMTSSDWTFYPFRSNNLEDFRNLQSIYLDAVFFPNLREEDFFREGCHVFLDQKTQKNKFGGVVFNEMKGVFSDTDSLLEHQMRKSLFPNTAYRFESGGIPLSITELTLKEISEFHRRFYSPANAVFYSYGNFPLREHARFVFENALALFPKSLPMSVEIDRQGTLPSRESELFVPAGQIHIEADKSKKVGIGFLCCDVSNVQESFDLAILSKLLLDGQNSPMYKELIEKGVGSDFTSNIGFCNSIKQATFSVGLKSISSESARNFKCTVRDILSRHRDLLLKDDRVEAILNQVKLSDKHISSDFGLNIGISLQKHFVHDINPINIFQVSEKAKTLRNTLKSNPLYFSHLIRKYFLDYDSSSTIQTTEDKNYLKNMEEEEAELASKISSDMVLQKEITKKASDHDSDILPTLSVDKDIPKNCETYPVSKTFVGTTKKLLYKSIQNTNGICYFTLAFDIRLLPPYLHSFLPLLSFCLTEFGSKLWSSERLSDLIDFFTGGISAFVDVNCGLESSSDHSEYFMVSTSCLHKNIPRAVDILREVLLSFDFRDEKKLRVNLKQLLEEKSDSLFSDGLSYASLTAASHQTAAASAADQYEGVSQIKFLSSLNSAEKAESQILQSFERILRIFTLHGFAKAFVAGELESVDLFAKTLNGGPKDFSCSDLNKNADAHDSDFSEDFCKKFSGNRETALKVECKRSLIAVPIQCNYVCVSFRTVPYMHVDHPPLVVLSQLLQWNFLHEEIREKGNAYGSGATQKDGLFKFWSYRDPNSVRTLETIGRSIHWLFSDSELDKKVEEALISVFSGLDRPISPFKRGFLYFSANIDDVLKQKNRERLLSVKKDDVLRVAEKYIMPCLKELEETIQSIKSDREKGVSNVSVDKVSVCITGSKELLRDLSEFEKIEIN